MVLKAPFGGYEQVGRRLANESLQHDILPYVLNVSRDKKGGLKYTLRDGPSYTGTFVDNEILGDRERRIIHHGTLFTLGATSIILREAGKEDDE